MIFQQVSLRYKIYYYDSYGDVYVQVSDAKIYKVDKTTGVRSEYATLPSSETHSAGMAFDSKGNLYVSILSSGDKVYKITGQGATPEAWFIILIIMSTVV